MTLLTGEAIGESAGLKEVNTTVKVMEAQFDAAQDTVPFDLDIPPEDISVLALYKRDLRRTHFLRAEQEVDLAQTMSAGREAEAILDAARTPIAERSDNQQQLLAPFDDQSLSYDDRQSLAQAIQAGQAARIEFIESNLPLVINIAKSFIGRGVDFEDLIQEGNIALMRSVDLFNPNMGLKFSGYATTAIFRRLTKAVDQQGWRHWLPEPEAVALRTANSIRKRLVAELGREPTIAEIAGQMGRDAASLEELWRVDYKLSSLDALTTTDEGPRHTLDLEDQTMPKPDQAAIADLRRNAVDHVMELLSDRERTVLYLRFGFDGDHERTFDEIGKHFGLTRERVRQIHGKTLSKMRHPSLGRLLFDYAS